MSAAAARRRKQLAARASAQAEAASSTDVVAQQLQKLLAEETLDEATAYEALQLAQSQVRKKIVAGEFGPACELGASAALALLQKQRVSVASQLLTLLIQTLKETQTMETPEWLSKLETLHAAHETALNAIQAPPQEALRLHRLQRDWLKLVCSWSASELGTVHYGHNRLHKLLAMQSWNLAQLEQSLDEGGGTGAAAVAAVVGEDDQDVLLELRCDAVQHMALAEEPLELANWLKTLDAPTPEQTKMAHTCPPALRDMLFTRSLLLMVAVENLRDATILLKEYMTNIETRDITMLTASYTNKEDGLAPSHVVFGCMLLRLCEKDVRTGPLYSWLLRSFRRELEGLYKSKIVLGYTTKIGKLYFNIQPPPSMMNMVENMMNMMGGGAGAGGAAGLNPAMMQALAAQMQGGM